MHILIFKLSAGAKSPFSWRLWPDDPTYLPFFFFLDKQRVSTKDGVSSEVSFKPPNKPQEKAKDAAAFLTIGWEMIRLHKASESKLLYKPVSKPFNPVLSPSITSRSVLCSVALFISFSFFNLSSVNTRLCT